MSEKITNNKKSFFQKRIPTLVGLGILIVALVAGTILFSDGTGVFAPRATPQTTPKKIRISNVTDSSFTVSFLTDEATTGLIKYGTEANKLNSQASDDRDQLSGSIDQYQLHHITVRGLQPGIKYYYTLGTGSGSFDNEGQPFAITTAQRSGVPSAAKTIYGSVVEGSGNPAEGAIVYVKLEGVGEMSSLVKGSGSWAIPLSNARKADGSTYAQISDEDTLTLFIQGNSATLTSEVTTLVADAQPVSNITLGESQNLAEATTTTGTQAQQNSTNQDVTNQSATTAAQLDELATLPDSAQADSAQAKSTGSDLGDFLAVEEASESSSATTSVTTKTDSNATASATTLATVVDLVADEAASSSSTVETTQPKIIGKAAPNATISIQVHSDTQIDQYIVADANGDFELDIAALSEELEPGEHTVTYSYEDPASGETITKTQTFYVADDAQTLAQADTGAAAGGTTDDTSSNTNDYPYSSSNPYPIDASDSGEATDSATSSSRAAQPSTQSAMPVSGSVETTYALVFGGLFFIMAGIWSWWIASNLEAVEVKE